MIRTNCYAQFVSIEIQMMTLEVLYIVKGQKINRTFLKHGLYSPFPLAGIGSVGYDRP